MREMSPVLLDKVSAIWMLACNDRDAILTYRGIRHRFPSWELSEDKVRALVRDRAELFSPVVASRWFKDWQLWVTGNVDGEGHYPGWVIDLHPDPTDPARKLEIKKLRDDEIDKLTRNDVFRCQFRTDTRPPPNRPDPCVPVCEPDEVKLGLEHVDRLRKAEAEAREEQLKRWTGLIIPVLAILVSGATAALSIYTTRQTAGLAAAEAEIKLWDLAARVRGDAYASLLDALQLAFNAAGRGDEAEMQTQLTHVRLNVFRLEPLIVQSDSREQMWGDYKKFETLCSDRLVASRRASAPDPAAALQFDKLRNEMHDRLYRLLFEKNPMEFDPMKPMQAVAG